MPTDPLEPLRVLVIDDHAAVREGLARLIGASPGGYRVATAAGAAEAHAAMAASPAQLVVLDVDLAGEDGLALLPALRRHARVLVLTSHGDPATRVRALRQGAEAFVETNAPAAVLMAQLGILARLHSRGELAPPQGGASSLAESVGSSLFARPRHP